MVDEGTTGVAAAPMADDPKYWAGFHRVPYVGPTRIDRLLRRFGTLERAWSAAPAELRAVLDERSVESLLKTRSSLGLDAEMDRYKRAGIAVVTRVDAVYPRLLAEISAPPPVLYVRGNLLERDEVAVAIVGTRRATGYGREVTNRLATDLAAAGITIVSGLARGVDAVAHQAALRAGGRTIAVLGSGPDVIYPPEHHNLAEEIIANGAVLSDYPPGRKPDGPNFPARNRIISGLSLGVVIAEAPVRSGALITADFAADQSREVFVVPGSILSASGAGGLRLLRDGARLVTSAEDILEDLKLLGSQQRTAVQQPLPFESEPERRLHALLTGDGQHIDDLAAALNLPIGEVSGLLLTMELKGLVRNTGAQHYTRG
ncbi:MAG: DNA-processing protein DprA [Chloroflexota bacterium]|nr:DNA-processing protein DprA [Chloroflexota bacterium]